MSDLLYSDVEDSLRASARTLLAKQAPVAATIRWTESGASYDPALWRALAVDLGIAALPVPEERGGLGASFREVGTLAEELGASVAPTPYLGHTMAVTAARIARMGDVLPALISGERTATLAVPAGTVWGDHVHVEDGLLTGSVRGVIDARDADVFLVPTDDGMRAVEAEHVTRTPVESLDMTRPLHDLTFDGAPSIAESPRGTGARDTALMIGGAVLASEQLGIAQRCLDMSVDHLKTRYQFGRPLGSYQALKHRVADIWSAVTQSRAVARYAVASLADHDGDAPVAAELALAFCGPVAVKAAEECVQLHGGIGFTWEHPAHLYLKRAKANAVLLRSPRQHRLRLGELVGLTPA
jgi:alkylation response protein AidB-like acyl-CoA dehydrogenase